MTIYNGTKTDFMKVTYGNVQSIKVIELERVKV